MTSIIFLATVIAIFYYFIKLTIKIIKQKQIFAELRILTIIISIYSIIWCFSYLLSGDKMVSLGTDICFDDWCATITNTERSEALGFGDQVIKPQGQFIILSVTMSNHARRIAQRPSEPRIHLIDEAGKSWSFSKEGQQALERHLGSQIALDSKLALHQSLQTLLVFDVPKSSENLRAIIEEGPWITKLLFKEDRKVFKILNNNDL
ncbi:MAG: hypothetical protein WCP85_25690 [Mariniphaga sp.]